MNGDADARPPRELTPAFYGCYDWHSSVHGHWLLARLARLLPGRAVRRRRAPALGRSLTPANVAAEVAYLKGAGASASSGPTASRGCCSSRRSFASGARRRRGPGPRRSSRSSARRSRALRDWLPKLTQPIRIGEHSQTAFALGLVLDWARVAGDEETRRLVEARSRDFYGRDRGCPLAYEPSGEDFLSPCLGEADLMRRVLPPAEYACVALGVPAGVAGRRPRRLARAGGRDRPDGPEARAPRRPQSQPRLDARRHGAAASR